MQLTLVSGLSGSGKSIALRVLEDGGFYCVDNLPGTLLLEAVAQLIRPLVGTRIRIEVTSKGSR